MIASGFSGWVVETMVATTLLMLLVLALRRPVAAAFGARTAYALWALPTLRLLLPPLPGWAPLYVPVAHSGPANPLTIAIVDPATAAHLARDVAPPLAGTPPSLDLLLAHATPSLLVFWLAGAALWFGWQLLRYRGFLARALAEAEPLTRVGATEVLITPAVSGPMAAGVLRRRIFLPADFLGRYGAAERRLALLHEGAHHDRGDLVANFIGLAVVALHWWNPVAHWAWRAFRSDQELACDATVLAGADGADRAAYGRAVLKSACAAAPVAACAMNDKSHLKQRIVMMRERPLGRMRRLAGTAAVAGLVLSGLLVSASGRAPVAPVRAVAAVVAMAPVAPVAPVAVPMASARPVAAIPPPAPPAPASPPRPVARVATTRAAIIPDNRAIAATVAEASSLASADAARAIAVSGGARAIAIDAALARAHRVVLMSASEGSPSGETVVKMAADGAEKGAKLVRRVILRCHADAPGAMDCGGPMAFAMVAKPALDATIAEITARRPPSDRNDDRADG